MLKVLFVLVADRLQQIAIQKQNRVELNCPGLRIRLGIVERELDIQVPDVAAVEALGHT